MVFSGVVIAPGVCHPGLGEGLYFTDGRADVSVLLRVFDYRTWFQCLRKVWNVENSLYYNVQLVLKTKKSIFSLLLVKNVPCTDECWVFSSLKRI